MERSVKQYSQYYKELWPSIYNFANKILADEDKAADVAQRSFLKAWENYEKYDHREHLKAALYVMARNDCFNELQAMSRRPQCSIDAIASTGKENEFGLITQHQVDEDFAFINAEVFACLAEGVEALPPECKRTFKLFWNGYGNSSQIAEGMGVTRKTALNQKLKAIKLLREWLQKKMGIQLIKNQQIIQQ